MAANPARGQLNKGKQTFPYPRSRLRIWSRETGCSFSTLRLNLVLTRGIGVIEWSVWECLLSSIHHRRYFQHAHFIPIVGVGKRGEY